MGTTIQRRDNTTRETPPPPVRDGDGTRPAGSEILDEVPGDLGVVLWLALRRVNGWVLARQRRSRTDGDPAAATDDRATEAEPFAMREAPERPSLSAAGKEAPELWDALRTFVLLCEMPDLVPPEQFRDACGEVWKWAEDGDRIQTAAYFAEAAAYLDPLSPEWANQAGRSCRRAALVFRAGMWFYRAFGLGVRKKSHKQCTRALFRYGVLLHHLAEYKEAQRYFWKAIRRAMSGGHRREAGAAHHMLIVVSAECGSYARGERHAAETLSLYPHTDERLPELVYDFSYLLCEHQLYSYAVPLIRAVIPYVRKDHWQSLAWGNAARAYAGAGHREQAMEAVQRAAELGERYTETAAGAFTMAAVGACILGDFAKAKTLARRGLEIGQLRSLPVAVRRATDVLRSAASEIPAPSHGSAPSNHRIELLTRQFLDRLQKWRPRQELGPPSTG